MDLERVDEGLGPVHVATRATQLLAEVEEWRTELARQRREALTSLIVQGWTRQALADELGVTKARVNQIVGFSIEKAPPVVEDLVAEPTHRHSYESQAWNLVRGTTYVRQACSCGDVRVVPMHMVPANLRGSFPDKAVGV